MRKAKTCCYLLLALFGVAGGLFGQASGNRVFVLPSGSSLNITVLDANTLANVGTIPATQNVFQVLATPDGSKYYVLSNNSTRTLTIVNATNLAVTRQLDLGANASAGALTPDGRRLLITAGNLRVYDTATDTEVGNLPVGTGPTDIEVSQDSTQAYVMSSSSGVISLVNLSNNTVANQFSIAGPISMAVTPSNHRLLVLSQNTLTVMNPNNGNVISTIPVLVPAGKLLVTPDSGKAVILNRGLGPVASQIVDLSTQAVTTIGTGGTAFDQIVLQDSTTAIGIISGTSQVAKIDLTTGSITGQSYGANTRAVRISPNGKTAYLASLSASTVTRVDLTNNSASNPQTLAVPPVDLFLSFPPPTSNAANMIINGGDRQNLVGGQKIPFPLSVLVTTSDSSPVFNYPVTFATSAAGGVTITPAQPSSTNSRGIATAFVTAPAASSSLQGEPQASVTAVGLADAGPVQQAVQTISVTASAAGTGGVSFTVTISTSTGIVAVSGSNQIARPAQQFPLPLVVRVTDLQGFPVSKDTVVSFRPLGPGALPPFTSANTDADGVAQTTAFRGDLSSTPTLTSFAVTIVATVDSRPDLGSASFLLITSIFLPEAPVIYSGDDQTGFAGTQLASPLCVQLPNFPTAAFNLGVYWEIVSGPAGAFSAVLNPAVSPASGGISCTQMTLGPSAGDVVIRAFVPGIANATPGNPGVGDAQFRIHVRSTTPATINKLQGDNQEGRPGTTLPLALRVVVLDSGGNRVPLPNTQYPLSFTVSPPEAATVQNFFQQGDGEASVLVKIGNFAGAFTVTAVSGNGRAVFNLRSTTAAAAAVLVSGNNQSVPVGGTSAQQLVVRVNDAQGNPVPGVDVTFSGPSTVTLVPAQGAPGNPLKVTTGSDGRAAVAARAAAGTPVGSITITASASAGSVTFTLTVTGRSPSFTVAAIVNGASFVGGGLVPGGLASLFGTGLSEITGTEDPGGATSHRGVTLRIDGQAVPLFGISNASGTEQINFQARTDLVPQTTVRVEVTNNGATTSVANVPVLRVQPGIFEFPPPQGSNVKIAAAIKPDGSPIGPNNRVPRGTAFSVYLTGMGPSLPLLSTGQVGPIPPAVTFFSPTVTIGSRPAQLLFSGVAPRFVINQINVLVPPDAPVGDAVTLDIIVEGVASQTSRIAIQ